ncbi:hypothetical protein [Tunturiibacter gelidoferens]|uniref:Uncharacterized protein n=1 Tax=Tunturiibacter lichenicola TaxID=2051959 RepID=A0A7Y9NSD8_9BACT|nr:hypothetical protein [Edaphobacter lichenicola]NYF54098.1 hypothetical protein [Edaphobacter lichenicola]
MAPPRTWLGRAEEIVEVLRKMKSPQIDRPAIEELFQLQRRAAITLMKQAGALAGPGEEFLVGRRELVVWVEKTFKTEAAVLERKKSAGEELSRSVQEVQAVRAALHAQGRPPVSFPLVDDVLRATFTSLPSSVCVEPGRITIDFPAGQPEAVLPLLYELSMAIANDFGGLREICNVALSIDELLSDLQRSKELVIESSCSTF